MNDAVIVAETRAESDAEPLSVADADASELACALALLEPSDDRVRSCVADMDIVALSHSEPPLDGDRDELSEKGNVKIAVGDRDSVADGVLDIVVLAEMLGRALFDASADREGDRVDDGDPEADELTHPLRLDEALRVADADEEGRAGVDSVCVELGGLDDLDDGDSVAVKVTRKGEAVSTFVG